MSNSWCGCLLRTNHGAVVAILRILSWNTWIRYVKKLFANHTHVIFSTEFNETNPNTVWPFLKVTKGFPRCTRYKVIMHGMKETKLIDLRATFSTFCTSWLHESVIVLVKMSVLFLRFFAVLVPTAGMAWGQRLVYEEEENWFLWTNISRVFHIKKTLYLISIPGAFKIKLTTSR